jgi:hypothetical protein
MYMAKRRGILLLMSLSAIAVIIVSLVAACGSKSDKSNTNASVSYTSTDQAAKSSSSANAAVDLSQSMNDAAAGLGANSNPTPYNAPGINSNADTSSLSAIDPQLKSLADGMIGQMKSTVVVDTVARARAMRSAHLASAPSATSLTISGYCVDGVGTFKITGSDSSTVTYKEYTVDIVLNACPDSTTSIHSVSTGTIHVYEKELNDNSSVNRHATIDLTALDYNSAVLTKTKKAKGDFNADESGSLTSRTGTNSANGSYSETVPVSGGEQVGTFYFTSLSGAWTWDLASNVKTVSNTLNGSFGYSIVSPTGSLKLDIALANLQDKVRHNDIGSLLGSRDRWINGSITITWTPDLSVYGCIGGTITFTTAQATPLHYSIPASNCPASGTLVINNATIIYGNPIVIKVGNDQKTFNSCAEMDHDGLCGGNN